MFAADSALQHHPANCCAHYGERGQTDAFVQPSRHRHAIGLLRSNASSAPFLSVTSAVVTAMAWGRPCVSNKTSNSFQGKINNNS
jgi:hypothetical protein